MLTNEPLGCTPTLICSTCNPGCGHLRESHFHCYHFYDKHYQIFSNFTQRSTYLRRTKAEFI